MRSVLLPPMVEILTKVKTRAASFATQTREIAQEVALLPDTLHHIAVSEGYPALLTLVGHGLTTQIDAATILSLSANERDFFAERLTGHLARVLVNAEHADILDRSDIPLVSAVAPLTSWTPTLDIDIAYSSYQRSIDFAAAQTSFLLFPDVQQDAASQKRAHYLASALNLNNPLPIWVLSSRINYLHLPRPLLRKLQQDERLGKYRHDIAQFRTKTQRNGSYRPLPITL
jgi:hypothetical protein